MLLHSFNLECSIFCSFYFSNGNVKFYELKEIAPCTLKHKDKYTIIIDMTTPIASVFF